MNSYGGVRCKDFCYDAIQEFLSDIDTQSHNFEEVTSNKNNSTSRDKGSRAGNRERRLGTTIVVPSGHWDEVLI